MRSSYCWISFKSANTNSGLYPKFSSAHAGTPGEIIPPPNIVISWVSPVKQPGRDKDSNRFRSKQLKSVASTSNYKILCFRFLPCGCYQLVTETEQLILYTQVEADFVTDSLLASEGVAEGPIFYCESSGSELPGHTASMYVTQWVSAGKALLLWNTSPIVTMDTCRSLHD